MPKKDNSGLGRCLIKAHKKRGHYATQAGFRHTSDLPDGRDLGRLNLNSVTEQTSLDDFLDKAALAENDFIAEIANVKIVNPSNGIMSEEERAMISSVQDENKEILCIPRRPHWDINHMTKEEIDANEREAFLNWRRKLAVLQETQHINLTPFEKNLEIWRQLWRVIERSHVIAQIIDARNPLLFRCPDLEEYVKEVDNKKLNILLLNKADLLTETERKCWCDYFEDIGMKIVFFSALQEGQRPPESEDVVQNPNERSIDIDSTVIRNSPDVLSREELLHFFKYISQQNKTTQHVATVGLVGYPNVGKSSTLNALLMSKKVSVSATPGKTKHFQTFLIEEDFCLCDCPGLVFPNFVSTKADMVINGILPIDQLTEWNQPISLVASMIPKKVLEASYSILIPTPGEGRDPNSPPTAEEFLNAHGYNRGYMTKRGLPDNARSARYILKDFVNGKLLYCHAPPGVKQEEYHTYPEIKSKKTITGVDGSELNVKPKIVLSEADKKFFSKNQVHMLGNALNSEMPSTSTDKPWRKHNNRNKKEKLRRVYKEYD